MKCTCGMLHRHNTWQCGKCGQRLEGGVVFVTSISGSGAETVVSRIKQVASHPDHAHAVQVHDVGGIMHRFACENEPDVRWDRILDADPRMLRLLRALAFQEITHQIQLQPDHLHIIDLHLSFRWFAYLTQGFEPHILSSFADRVRCYINLIEDLAALKERLAGTAWGERKILELLIWRDEELFLTDLFADIFGRVDAYAVSAKEPPTEIERLIWHPEVPKVYLSFPITHILGDTAALEEIMKFRDRVRKFLVVFDPYACKDYDETYTRTEMTALRRQVGETTEDRDYRFIDQADAVVVYYPRRVASKGVDAEMKHARRTGKPIFLYCPEDPGGGPFAVPATHCRSDREEFMQLLRRIKEIKP